MTIGSSMLKAKLFSLLPFPSSSSSSCSLGSVAFKLYVITLYYPPFPSSTLTLWLCWTRFLRVCVCFGVCSVRLAVCTHACVPVLLATVQTCGHFPIIVSIWRELRQTDLQAVKHSLQYVIVVLVVVAILWSKSIRRRAIGTTKWGFTITVVVVVVSLS